MLGLTKKPVPTRLLEHNDPAGAQTACQRAQGGNRVWQEHKYETSYDGIKVTINL